MAAARRRRGGPDRRRGSGGHRHGPDRAPDGHCRLPGQPLPWRRVAGGGSRARQGEGERGRGRPAVRVVPRPLLGSLPGPPRAAPVRRAAAGRRGPDRPGSVPHADARAGAGRGQLRAHARRRDHRHDLGDRRRRPQPPRAAGRHRRGHRRAPRAGRRPRVDPGPGGLLARRAAGGVPAHLARHARRAAALHTVAGRPGQRRGARPPARLGAAAGPFGVDAGRRGGAVRRGPAGAHPGVPGRDRRRHRDQAQRGGELLGAVPGAGRPAPLRAAGQRLLPAPGGCAGNQRRRPAARW